MRVGGAADCEAALRAEVATGEVRREINRSSAAAGLVTSVAFAPDGAWLAVGCGDRKTTLVEVATGEVRREIERGGPVNSVAFSPDGAWPPRPGL